MLSRWIFYLFLVLFGIVAMTAAMISAVLILTYPNLPSLEILTDYRPKIPLRVYTAEGYLIGEFGEERRAFVRFENVPEIMKQAILAAEDERFYQHRGVDALSIVRAAASNLLGGRRQGASTITQQVARNFFLSSEQTYSRKFYEALLSFKIEHSLTKDQIFELYINQIYLGQRAYGFALAAQVYFGKSLKELSIAETAMLAGLPKAPSAFNPVVNPKRASLRQQYVLRRLRQLNFIDDVQYEAALQQPLVVRRETGDYAVHAEYVAEMARQITAEQFPEDVYSRGLRVYTTITRADQEAAYASLRRNVLDYDRRHGYRGAEAYVDLSEIKSEQDEALDVLLLDYHDSEDIHPAVVFEADARRIRAYRRGGEIVTITGDGLKFAARMIDDKAPADKRLRRGAIIRVQQDDKNNWRVMQMPEIEAAFLSVDPRNGTIRSLVGGFDFGRNKFNHTTQAWRQPGSSFKPFIYSGALEKSFTPASLIEDEPISIPASVTGSQAWEPKNYDGKYEGPMRLRTALAKSKNVVSIRVLQASGLNFIQDYITHFGFDANKHPAYLTMALGAGSVTPWQMVTAYSVFASGGYKIQPFIVSHIRDDKDQVVAEAQPVKAGDESLLAIDPRNAYLMDSMLRDVTLYGTAARASAILKRRDLAGKTGTTNEQVDAWFCGYQRTVVGCSWIGFDQPKNMGSRETGTSAALPAWIGYMSKVLKDVPQSFMRMPKGLVVLDVVEPDKEPIKEYFYKENIPPPEPEPEAAPEPAPEPPQDEDASWWNNL
ncbi:MAG: penicillin-binding protein 1A [Candidatus Accumulibacter sp.]|jgi:penicillin-binding protein 1A|nr:penicillin-binding protein 1A [Accumulibacter sp.]